MTTLPPRPKGVSLPRGNEDVKTGETGFRRFPPRDTGAAEESRTLDLNLGKVALYQLSYCRDELRIIPFPRPSFNRIPRKTQGKTRMAWASTCVPRTGSYVPVPGVFHAALRYTTIDQSVITAAMPMSRCPTGRVSKKPNSQSS